VRGIGLLNAVEFVADRRSKQPFARADGVTERVTGAAFERGLTVYPCPSAVDGHVGDAVILGPPLSVTEDDLDQMVDRLVASVLATLPC
jgi:adenosylmethionine-8-amino-7-oxononanoate aminotransferase